MPIDPWLPEHYTKRKKLPSGDIIPSEKEIDEYTPESHYEALLAL